MKKYQLERYQLPCRVSVDQHFIYQLIKSAYEPQHFVQQNSFISAYVLCDSLNSPASVAQVTSHRTISLLRQFNVDSVILITYNEYEISSESKRYKI